MKKKKPNKQTNKPKKRAFFPFQYSSMIWYDLIEIFNILYLLGRNVFNNHFLLISTAPQYKNATLIRSFNVYASLVSPN